MIPPDHQSNPSYEQLERLLRDASVTVHPAEGHGLLCGMLCTHSPRTPASWLEEVLADTSPSSALGAARHALEGVRSATERQLAGADLDLRLLLPDEDTALPARVEALGLWCVGFLAGLGLGDASGLRQASLEAQEFMHDLAELTRVESELDEEETAEADYAHIVEYVRMGTLMLYTELHVHAPPPPSTH